MTRAFLPMEIYFKIVKITRESFKKFLLVELLYAASKLRGSHFLSYVEVLIEAEEVVEEAEKMDVRVDWFDSVIKKILKEKDHQKFAQKVNSIRKHMEAL